MGQSMGSLAFFLLPLRLLRLREYVVWEVWISENFSYRQLKHFGCYRPSRKIDTSVEIPQLINRSVDRTTIPSVDSLLGTRAHSFSPKERKLIA